MGRSHPPSLITRTRRTLRDETDVRRGDRLLIGVSGGSDSTALLHVLQRLSGALGVGLFAHGVDHGLRAAATEELDKVERLATSWGVPFARTCVQLPSQGNLQANARKARYAALDAAAARVGARWVVTAHHASDRAETVLLRLLSGSGPTGLGVLPACSPGRLRPFIRSPKQAIRDHLERHQLRFSEDPSNQDSRFTRTRIRSELLPLLEDIRPGASARLNDLADALTAGPPPQVVDPEGRPVALGREQIVQLRRVLRQGKGRVWLKNGLQVDLAAGSEQAAPGGKPLHPQSVAVLLAKRKEGLPSDAWQSGNSPNPQPPDDPSSGDSSPAPEHECGATSPVDQARDKPAARLTPKDARNATLPTRNSKRGKGPC